MDDFWLAAAWAILPTLVVSLLFFWVIRSMIAARNERRAYARLEAKERARRGLPPAPEAPASGN